MMNPSHDAVHGDCLEELQRLPAGSVDLVYLDPPFYSNRKHSAVTRDRRRTFTFADLWDGFEEYAEFMHARLLQVHRVLKPTGSVFLHCDTSANFLLRRLLDDAFGCEQFRSEIIWAYKRWSNSVKGLMPAHQTLYFYSKSDAFKFNRVFGEYSETTNVDQILQLRARDVHGVSQYATDEDGKVIYANQKKGVPLSDVWEIPFLNPKAKERTGYPTQKPVLLLERIIELTTSPGDFVVDPFCGSGTTLVAAALLNRRALGIDSSAEAVELSRERLKAPAKTESALLRKGRASYLNANPAALDLLSGLDLIPVHRNSGIDAFIRSEGALIPVRVQRDNEPLCIAAQLLGRAALSKNSTIAILVRTGDGDVVPPLLKGPCQLEIVNSTSVEARQRVSELLNVLPKEKAIELNRKQGISS